MYEISRNPDNFRPFPDFGVSMAQGAHGDVPTVFTKLFLLHVSRLVEKKRNSSTLWQPRQQPWQPFLWWCVLKEKRHVKDRAFSGRGFDQHQRRLQLKYDALALCCVCCFCCFCRVAFCCFFFLLFVLSRCFSLLDVSPVENTRIRVPHRPTQRSEGRVWGEGKVHLLHVLHLPMPLYSSLVSKNIG